MSTTTDAPVPAEIPVIEGWVSTVDAASELEMSRQYVHRLASQGLAGPFRSNGKVMVRRVSQNGPQQFLIARSAIDRYARERAAKAQPEPAAS